MLIDILLFVVLIPIITFSPLVSFSPKMARARNDAILRVGELLHKHNLAFGKKWLDPNADFSSLLGSVDNSSLADINGSYQTIKGMNVIPFELKHLMIGVAILLVPFLPLLGTIYSMNELIRRVAAALLGAG